MVRFFMAASVALAAAFPAAANDLALVIGNANYSNNNNLRGGDSVLRGASALSRAGVETLNMRNAGRADMAALFETFAESARGAEDVAVVLSGRFVYSATDTYFLASDAARARIGAVTGESLPISVVLAVLSTHPGDAVLVLATDDSAEARGYLREGIGQIDIPQGVTVVLAGPEEADAFIRDVLAMPGVPIAAALRQRPALTGLGYLAEGMMFVERETPTAPPAPDDGLAAAWQRTLRADTVEAYQSFLETYPNSPFDQMARQRLATLLNDPARQARLAEEALNLGRAERLDVQRDLQTLGFNPRGIDGVFGAGTRAAISDWQRTAGFAVTGYVDRVQIQRLDQQAAQRETELRAEEERRDRAFWEGTGGRGTEDGYNAYLQRYPQGIYAAVARQRLAEIAEERRRAQAAADTAAFERARSQDTVQAYRRYLREFPEGQYRDRAEARIAVLRGEPDTGFDEEAARQREQALGLIPITRQLIEMRLAQLGFDPGPADGTFDAQTRDAIAQLQRSTGLTPTGYLDDRTVTRIWAGQTGR